MGRRPPATLGLHGGVVLAACGRCPRRAEPEIRTGGLPPHAAAPESPGVLPRAAPRTQRRVAR